MSSPIDSSSSIPLLLPTTTTFSFHFFLLLLLLSVFFLFSPCNISHIPGPSSLVAAMALCSSTAHRSLADISRSLAANRLMAFSLGFSRFIISSHPETAKEILSSSAFTDRPLKESARQLLFHRAIGFAPFGDYWRKLRRISAANLFCPRGIEASGVSRREIGEWMVEKVGVLMEQQGEVEMKGVLHLGALNNVMMILFGEKSDFGEGEGVELEGMVREGYELLGALNWADYFPLFRWMDLQGVGRRSRILAGKVNVFVGRIIEEHRMKGRVDGVGDFVDVLLGLKDEEMFSDSDIVAVLWVRFPVPSF